jgi:hypothetical protein
MCFFVFLFFVVRLNGHYEMFEGAHRGPRSIHRFKGLSGF